MVEARVPLEGLVGAVPAEVVDEGVDSLLDSDLLELPEPFPRARFDRRDASLSRAL